MKYFIVYQIKNLMTDGYYIGAHETKNITDNYMGSSPLLRADIKTYGKQNFSKEILMYCSSREEMFEQEIKIIGNYWKTDDLCYNQKPGGKGGWHSVNESGTNLGANNAMKRPEIVEKVGRAILLIRNGLDKEIYDNISRQNLKISHQRAIGRKKPKHALLMKERSHLKALFENPETREKLRDAMSDFFIVQTNTGEIFETNRLIEFSANQGMPFTTLYASARDGGRKIIKGKAKGWKCQKKT
jgi:hypothetical protein